MGQRGRGGDEQRRDGGQDVGQGGTSGSGDTGRVVVGDGTSGSGDGMRTGVEARVDTGLDRRGGGGGGGQAARAAWAGVRPSTAPSDMASGGTTTRHPLGVTHEHTST